MLTCWCSAAIKFAIFTIVVHLRLKCNLKKKKSGSEEKWGCIYSTSTFQVSVGEGKLVWILKFRLNCFRWKPRKKTLLGTFLFLHLAKRFLSDPPESLGTINVHASAHFKKSKSWDISYCIKLRIMSLLWGDLSWLYWNLSLMLCNYLGLREFECP